MTHVRRDLDRFVREDIGKGDITSALLGKKAITARIVSRQPAIVAGAAYAKEIFASGGCRITVKKKDGAKINKNDTIMIITGPAYTILSRERVALNLLSRMSGIATATRRLKKISCGAAIYATRKTAPGLRFFDKKAITIGGGHEHRMALDESIMIKDNHIAAEGSLEGLIAKAKKKHNIIEIEVDRPADALAAARAGVSIIMLDNFTPAMILKTIAGLKQHKLRKLVRLEASGGITEKNIKKYAKTGVDMISAGYLTNSVRAVDFSLEL